MGDRDKVRDQLIDFLAGDLAPTTPSIKGQYYESKVKQPQMDHTAVLHSVKSALEKHNIKVTPRVGEVIAQFMVNLNNVLGESKK